MNLRSLIRFKKMVDLLEAGKKVRVDNLYYFSHPCPKIVIRSSQAEDIMVLEAVSQQRCETYIVETPLGSDVEEVEIVDYVHPDVKEIVYLYDNLNRCPWIMAGVKDPHTGNITEVAYKEFPFELLILKSNKLSWFKGEYK